MKVVFLILKFLGTIVLSVVCIFLLFASFQETFYPVIFAFSLLTAFLIFAIWFFTSERYLSKRAQAKEKQRAEADAILQKYRADAWKAAQAREEAEIRKGQNSPPSMSSGVRYHFNELPDDLSLRAQTYAVFDVETTGLDAKTDRIIEIGVVRIERGHVVDTFSSLVNPGVSIPWNITELTGITSADVANAPCIDDLIPRIAGIIDNAVLVAHNAPFDMKFLAAAFRKYGVSGKSNYIDTLRLARQAFPGMPDYKLATLIPALGLLDHDQTHRALDDVYATAALYERCVAVLAGNSRSRIAFRTAPNPLQEQKAVKTESRDIDSSKSQEALEDKAYHLNQYGMQAEASGNIDKAISYYEDVVADGACLPHSYMRLAIIYKKRAQWADVIRVCDAALKVLPGTPGKLCQAEEYEKRKAYAQSKLVSK